MTSHIRAGICRWLYTIAILSYLADSMLIPFYPQYFKAVYGVESPLTSGIYIAVCRIAMLVSFQLWSRLANRYSVMRILCMTQGLAGITCLLCATAPTVGSFMAYSVVADIFKSSYLLLYPHIIRMAGQDREGSVISFMALIANLGIVLSVLIGGTLLDSVNPRAIIVAVAVFDWVQMLISYYIRAREPAPEEQAKVGDSAPSEKGQRNAAMTLAWLCGLMFAFYFSLVALRPFYTSYIEAEFSGVSMTAAGVIFIIPNIVAVFLAPWGSRITTDARVQSALAWSCAFVVLCTALQSSTGSVLCLVALRAIYGAALFVGEVALDYLLFRWSKEKELITNYSYINLSQNVAIIAAPLIASYSVGGFSLAGPFALSTSSALLTLGVVLLFFRCTPRLFARPFAS